VGKKTSFDIPRKWLKNNFILSKSGWIFTMIFFFFALHINCKWKRIQNTDLHKKPFMVTVLFHHTSVGSPNFLLKCFTNQTGYCAQPTVKGLQTGTKVVTLEKYWRMSEILVFWDLPSVTQKWGKFTKKSYSWEWYLASHKANWICSSVPMGKFDPLL